MAPVFTDSFQVDARLSASWPPHDRELLGRFTCLNMDPKRRSARDEWGFVFYDTVFRPDRCFHIEFQWLVATGCLVSEVIQSFQHRAEARGLRMITIPIYQVLPDRHGSDDRHGSAERRNAMPLRAPVRIPLAFSYDMPATDCVAQPNSKSFQELILFKFGFIADVMSSFNSSEVRPEGPCPQFERPQYIHVSGKAFVQILGDTGFAWISNHLLHIAAIRGPAKAARTPSLFPGTVAAEAGGEEDLLSEFSTFCSRFDVATHRWTLIADVTHC